MQQGILYKIKCQLCLQQGKNSYYMEVSQNWWGRGQDHLKALKNKDMKNVCVEHWVENHKDQEWPYKMKITQVFDRPLNRQVIEGFLIENYKGDIVITNEGREWGCYVPSQLQIVEDKKSENQNQSISSAPKQ